MIKFWYMIESNITLSGTHCTMNYGGNIGNVQIVQSNPVLEKHLACSSTGIFAPPPQSSPLH